MLVLERDVLKIRTPLVLKIAPDIELDTLDDIVDVALCAGIEGLIVSNTTVARPASLKRSSCHKRNRRPVRQTALRTIDRTPETDARARGHEARSDWRGRNIVGRYRLCEDPRGRHAAAAIYGAGAARTETGFADQEGIARPSRSRRLLTHLRSNQRQTRRGLITSAACRRLRSACPCRCAYLATRQTAFFHSTHCCCIRP